MLKRVWDSSGPGFQLLPALHRAYGQCSNSALHCRIWVTCGRRPGKSFFDVCAALVGCGHVSGLLMRQVWPLALMLCADRVPIVRMHLEVR